MLYWTITQILSISGAILGLIFSAAAVGWMCSIMREASGKIKRYRENRCEWYDEK